MGNLDQIVVKQTEKKNSTSIKNKAGIETEKYSI